MLDRDKLTKAYLKSHSIHPGYVFQANDVKNFIQKYVNVGENAAFDYSDERRLNGHRLCRSVG